MQEQKHPNPWWFLQPLQHPNTASSNKADTPLQRALQLLLEEPPLEHTTPLSSSSVETNAPLPPLLPYLQMMHKLIEDLDTERNRAPARQIEYSQRLHNALQHLRHAFLAIEQELRWLDPQHPLISTLSQLLKDLTHDIQHTQKFLQKTTDSHTQGAQQALSFEQTIKELEEEDLYAPIASPASTLYGTPPLEKTKHAAEDTLEELIPEIPDPPPLSAEELQQTLLSLQQTSKSGVRLNIPGYDPQNSNKPESSSSLRLETPPSRPENKIPPKREAFQAEPSFAPPQSSPKSKTKDIPATIERIRGRIEQVTDASSFRCAINELEQATHIIPDQDWDVLCERLCQRGQDAQVEAEEWEKFPSCRLFWQRRNNASSQRFEAPHSNEPPDSKHRGRFRDLLDDTFFALYRRIVDDVCGTPMSYLDQHSEDERYLMLTIWSARTRWVQDQLPEDELGVQGFLRTLFGRINSARKDQIGNNYWIEPLNRRFFAEWPAYISEYEQKLAQLRNEQQAQQIVLSEQEERAWQQEMRVYIWLSKLRKSIRALAKPATPDHPTTQVFLRTLREILEDEMNPSDTDLLELLEPYEDLIQHGSEFRHLRRHLRKLKEQSPEERAALDQAEANLASMGSNEPASHHDEDEDEAYSHQLQRRRDAKKLRTILPVVQERNAVIIGGDEREQARERLETMLQLKSLEWIPREGGNPRVLDRLEERIASGKVTLVLLLIRFSGHDTSRIIQACKRAGALWVPIDHGYGESRILHSLSYYLLEQESPAEA